MKSAAGLDTATRERKENADMKNRNLKYGGMAVALTAAFIAIVVVVNVIFTALSAKFNWYTDLTSAGIYSISNEFKDVLDSLVADTDENTTVNVVLMSEEDRFASSSTEAGYVYKTLKQVEAYCDKIRVKGINSVREKEEISRYQLTEYDTVYTNDVVFELADKDGKPILTAPTKKYQLSAFFKKNSEKKVIGYDAEARILSAVAQILNKSEKPVVYYITGHGEPTLAEASAWEELFNTAGYEIREINLALEDFPVTENENRNNDIILINAPVFDLLSPTAEDLGLVNEKAKIDKFLKKNFGHLIVTEGASTTHLPVLNGLLSEWGITMSGSVSDTTHSASASGGVSVMADSSQTTENVPKQIVERAVGSNSTAHVVFNSPRAMTVDSSGLSLVGGLGSQGVFPLLLSYSTAVTRISDDKTNTGNAILAAIGLADWDLNDDGNISYVLALGTTDFLSYGSSANESIMYSVLELMWTSRATFGDIQYKSFDSNSLSSTTAQANVWTIVFVVALPLAVAVVGITVWIRRRHS